MSNGDSSSGFKVGKLYVCRNPLFGEYHAQWYWVLFAGVNNWEQETRMLYEHKTFMVLETFSEIDYENNGFDYWIWIWIKVLTEDGLVGWFRYSSDYDEKDVVEEIKSC